MQRFPEEFQTERLLFHKHRIDEYLMQYKVVESERERLGEWLPWVAHTKTAEDTRRNMELSHEEWESRSVFDYTIKTLGGEFLGRVGLYRIDWSVPRAEIGYWLRESAIGKGYLNEGIKRLEQECFKLHFERLEIRCDPHNLRSAAVARKLGYQREGTLRKNIRIAGKLRDTEVWAKLRGA